jgi:hypothetical protein
MRQLQRSCLSRPAAMLVGASDGLHLVIMVMHGAIGAVIVFSMHALGQKCSCYMPVWQHWQFGRSLGACRMPTSCVSALTVF